VLSLAWSARRLVAAGQKDAALKLYGQALAIAVPGESPLGALATYSDDPVVPRYRLPGEERVREILGELASRSEWTFAEWSPAIPDSAMVRLAAARLLRDRSPSDADALLDLIIGERSASGAVSQNEPAGIGPLTLAARAEAFALKSRWNESAEHYRRAIAIEGDDTIKRSWWFNLADIAFHLDDERERDVALRASVAVATSDDISRRASDIQRAIHKPANPRSIGMKAN
jgi:hypothetical protein